MPRTIPGSWNTPPGDLVIVAMEMFSHRHGGHWEAKLDMVTGVVVTTSDLDINVLSQTKLS